MSATDNKAVDELIAADRAYDICKARLTQANNRLVGKAASHNDYVEQSSAQHAFDRAADQRQRALANIGATP